MAVLVDTRRVHAAALLDTHTVRSLCARAIRTVAPRIRDITISVAWVDRRRMRQANERYRGRRGATDVLSFVYTPLGVEHHAARSGEILLCPAVIRERAPERGLTVRRSAEWLLVHAVLHLTGHEHRSSRGSRRMEREEARVLGGVPESVTSGGGAAPARHTMPGGRGGRRLNTF